MTIEEMFNHIGNNMIKGLMVHSQLVDYFGFLGFEGYQKCHLYHYFDEAKNFKDLGNYYLKHYNRLLVEDRIDNPNIIPNDQIQYNRQQVTNQIRQTALQAGIETQVEQERGTKKKYEQYYNAMISIGEIAAASALKKIIEDVDYELAGAEQELLELTAISFNLNDVMMYQNDMKKKYSKKLKEIEL